jgi:hypothetical protein
VSFEVCVCASSIVSKRPTFGVAVTDQSNTTTTFGVAVTDQSNTTTTFGHGIKSNTSGNTLHHVHCISVTFGYVSFEVCVRMHHQSCRRNGHRFDTIRYDSIQQMTTSATIHAKQTNGNSSRQENGKRRKKRKTFGQAPMEIQKAKKSCINHPRTSSS